MIKMIVNSHIHSRYSGDATASPKDIIRKSREIGLDAIAIADHNTLKGSILAMKESKDLDDFIVIPAMEVIAIKDISWLWE